MESDSLRPMECSPPGSLSMGFPRQEHWSGLPFPPLGDLPDPGINPVSSALAGGFFTTEPPRRTKITVEGFIIPILQIKKLQNGFSLPSFQDQKE